MKPIVSKSCRIRYPEIFKIGDYSIVDDFCYFSTRVIIGRYSHIATCSSVGGGRDYTFTLGNYCSVSSGARIWCQSNDFVNDLIVIKPKGVHFDDHPIAGNVTIENMCGVGANSVIMPNNRLPEGVAIGAVSFVPSHFKFKPWSVYAGIPIRFIKPRNKKNVLEQMKSFKKSFKATH